MVRIHPKFLPVEKEGGCIVFYKKRCKYETREYIKVYYFCEFKIPRNCKIYIYPQSRKNPPMNERKSEE
jgi:hypothetical protein